MNEQQERYEEALLLLTYARSRISGISREEFLKAQGLSADSADKYTRVQYEKSVTALKFAEHMPEEHLFRQAESMFNALGDYADSAQKASEIREELQKLILSHSINDNLSEPPVPEKKKKKFWVLLPVFAVLAAVAVVIFVHLPSHPSQAKNGYNASAATQEELASQAKTIYNATATALVEMDAEGEYLPKYKVLFTKDTVWQYSMNDKKSFNTVTFRKTAAYYFPDIDQSCDDYIIVIKNGEVIGVYCCTGDVIGYYPESLSPDDISFDTLLSRLKTKL